VESGGAIPDESGPAGGAALLRGIVRLYPGLAALLHPARSSGPSMPGGFGPGGWLSPDAPWTPRSRGRPISLGIRPWYDPDPNASVTAREGALVSTIRALNAGRPLNAGWGPDPSRSVGSGLPAGAQLRRFR
jgi:hypothetical protein